MGGWAVCVSYALGLPLGWLNIVAVSAPTTGAVAEGVPCQGSRTGCVCFAGVRDGTTLNRIMGTTWHSGCRTRQSSRRQSAWRRGGTPTVAPRKRIGNCRHD